MAKHSARRQQRPVRRFRFWILAGAGVCVLGVAAATPGALQAAPAPPGRPAAANGTTNDTQASLPSPLTGSEQAQLNNLLQTPQCTLDVPADPLSAAGLAQPWFLENATQACAENAQTGAFAQATILDPATGQLSVYYPLVVPQGQTPAAPPVVPVLPPGAVVTVWTGFNGNQLKLAGPGAGFFVNFAQQSWAGSPQFFQALRTAVAAGLVHVPPAGTANDGLPCPTTRDFSVVDQDQSDNVPLGELITPDGQPIQDSAVNRADFPGSTALPNGSDQGLLGAVDKALGCTPWSVPNLTDPGALVPSAPLQEEQAAVSQQPPVALVPGNDDFVTNNGQPANAAGRPDLFLQNLYRLQTGQPETGNPRNIDSFRYCAALGLTGAPRLQMDFDAEAQLPAPQAIAMTGTNLALALANRFFNSWAMLNCQVLTGRPSPVQVTLSGMTAIAATYRPYTGPSFGLTSAAATGSDSGNQLAS